MNQQMHHMIQYFEALPTCDYMYMYMYYFFPLGLLINTVHGSNCRVSKYCKKDPMLLMSDYWFCRLHGKPDKDYKESLSISMFFNSVVASSHTEGADFATVDSHLGFLWTLLWSKAWWILVALHGDRGWHVWHKKTASKCPCTNVFWATVTPLQGPHADITRQVLLSLGCCWSCLLLNVPAVWQVHKLWPGSAALYKTVLVLLVVWYWRTW